MTTTPSNTDANTGFQYIPVPNEYVPAVLTFLADCLRPTGATTDPAETAVSTQHSPEDWTDELLIRFASMDTKTSRTVVAMLDYLSDRPGEAAAVSTSELAEAINRDYFVMKNVPTQIARTLGKHFPGLVTPCIHRWGSDFSPARPDEVFFFVTAERADQWKRLQGARQSSS